MRKHPRPGASAGDAGKSLDALPDRRTNLTGEEKPTSTVDFREGWPVPPERCDSLMRAVFSQFSHEDISVRLGLAIVRFAISADRHYLEQEEAERKAAEHSLYP